MSTFVMTESIEEYDVFASIVENGGDVYSVSGKLKEMMHSSFSFNKQYRKGLFDYYFEKDINIFYLLLQSLKLLVYEKQISQENFTSLLNGEINKIKLNGDDGECIELYEMYRTYYAPIIMWISQSVGTQIHTKEIDIFGKDTPEVPIGTAKYIINFLLKNGASLDKTDYYGTSTRKYASDPEKRKERISERRSKDADELFEYILNWKPVERTVSISSRENSSDSV
jgi:hypothetical protein